MRWLLCVLFLFGCQAANGHRGISFDDEHFGVLPLPADDGAVIGRVTAGELRAEGFTKGVAVAMAVDEPIWIVAQQGVADIAVARARNLLQFFLSPMFEKGEVARKMAENRAMLMMPEGAHREGEEPDIPAQPLYEDETPIDGSRAYLTNDWEHRDAAFEEIFHLVHDMGIGTDLPGAMPDYQRDLDREARAAIADGRWGIAIEEGVADWLEELGDEGSLAQEYIASVLDTYYGLWGPFTERPGGMWGIYCAKTRDELRRKDPRGLELLERFLPPYLVGYEALIDPSFEGTFSLQFDERTPYTHKSRYLVDVRLTGDNDSGVLGNDQDNCFTGNRGDNHFDGGGGRDRVRYRGRCAEYSIDWDGDELVVVDLVAGRDGTDRLRNIYLLEFRDMPMMFSRNIW